MYWLLLEQVTTYLALMLLMQQSHWTWHLHQQSLSSSHGQRFWVTMTRNPPYRVRVWCATLSECAILCQGSTRMALILMALVTIIWRYMGPRAHLWPTNQCSISTSSTVVIILRFRQSLGMGGSSPLSNFGLSAPPPACRYCKQMVFLNHLRIVVWYNDSHTWWMLYSQIYTMQSRSHS